MWEKYWIRNQKLGYAGCRIIWGSVGKSKKKTIKKKAHIPKNVCLSEFKDVVSCAPSGAIVSVSIKNNENQNT